MREGEPAGSATGLKPFWAYASGSALDLKRLGHGQSQWHLLAASAIKSRNYANRISSVARHKLAKKYTIMLGSTLRHYRNNFLHYYRHL